MDWDDDYRNAPIFARRRPVVRRTVMPSLPPPSQYATPPYAPPPYAPPPPPVVYMSPPVPPPAYTYPQFPPRTGISISLRKINVGSLVDIAAQAFASFAPLPAAPAAAVPPATFDPQNLVTYQTGLAEHAKRDEQVRLIGAVAKMLLA